MTQELLSDANKRIDFESPPLLLSVTARNRLIDLASAVLSRMPRVAELLLDEADRAIEVSDEDLPDNVVRIGSYVEFRDEDSGQTRQVQLVYPHEADISLSKVSILTLVGAGLIGLSTGQSILWPTQQGHYRRITVTQVANGPFDSEAR